MFKGVFSAQEVYCSGDNTFSISKEKFLQVAGIWIAIMEGEPNEFIKSKIWPQFQYCIVDPDIKNIAAIKCYEKLNFQGHAVIDSEDALGQPVKLHLMILKR